MYLKPKVSENDHIKGDANAIIELVEYGDYQCPHCGRAYPKIKSMQQKFGANLRFVFRNFPLSEVHPQAKIAAVAAEAAAKQGKFWQMHDIIFENQQSLFASSLMKYAERIGLDLEQFEADLQNDVLFKRVEADLLSGIRSGVSHTPEFFVNGERYDGDVEEEHLSAYIQSKIELEMQSSKSHNSLN
jgi:protein-disulfide isomerase